MTKQEALFSRLKKAGIERLWHSRSINLNDRYLYEGIIVLDCDLSNPNVASVISNIVNMYADSNSDDCVTVIPLNEVSELLISNSNNYAVKDLNRVNITKES